MEGMHEQNENRKNPKINFMLSSKGQRKIGSPMMIWEENMRQ
jgi:hypothetical protein